MRPYTSRWQILSLEFAATWQSARILRAKKVQVQNLKVLTGIRMRPTRQLSALLMSAFCILLSGSGCGLAARAGAPPKLYEGATLADEQVALFDWACSSCDGSIQEIDGKKVAEVRGWDSRVAVLPGKHTLRYSAWYGGSVMLGPSIRTATRVDVVEVKAGHTYLVKSTRKGPWTNPSLYLWIEDATTEEPIAGLKP